MVKSNRIHLRTSQEDEDMLKKASEKLGTEKKSSTIRKSLETVAEMELIIIDRESISQMDKLSEYARATLQDFINEFFNLTGCNLTLQELEKIFEGTGKLGSRALVQKAIKQMVSNKLLEQLNKKYNGDIVVNEDNLPQKDLTTLFTIADKLDHTPTVRLGAPVTIYWGIYELTDGKITINDQRLEASKAQYRKYAQGPEQIEKLNKVKKLCQALNDICKDRDITPDQGIFSLVFFDKQAARWMPSGSWITMNEKIPRI